MKMITPIEAYNAAVPIMSELNDLGYDIDVYHNGSQGYGFYIDFPNNYYIQVHIFSLVTEAEYIATLYRNELYRNESSCSHDIFNRKIIDESSVTDAKDLKQPVLDLIKEVEIMSKKPTFKITDITKDEIDYLMNLAKTDTVIKQIVDKAKNE